MRSTEGLRLAQCIIHDVLDTQVGRTFVAAALRCVHVRTAAVGRGPRELLVERSNNCMRAAQCAPRGTFLCGKRNVNTVTREVQSLNSIG